MENLRVVERIEVCEELGLTVCGAKRKHAILEIMRRENVMCEEVQEALAEVKERCQSTEANERELRAERQKEADRKRRLEIKRL